MNEEPPATSAIHYPYPLFVYPTHFCNFRCSYCFTESDADQPVTTFVTRHWESILRQAARVGIPEIRISGGEPLMLPNIGQMCEAVTSELMTYTLTTNGSRLRHHLAWLRANPPETLWVSYHAEYYSPAELTRRLGVAATNIPRVGLNVFGTDCLAHPEILDLAVNAGTTR